MKKQKDPTDSPQIKIPPPVAFLAIFGIGVGIEVLSPAPFSFFISQWIGLALLLLGFVIAFPAVFKFMAMGNPLDPNSPSQNFMTQGFYRFTRNPMYLGAVCGFGGMGLLFQSLWVLLSSLAIFLYLERYVIPREEAYMKRTYGQSYQTYCAHVRRWL